VRSEHLAHSAFLPSHHQTRMSRSQLWMSGSFQMIRDMHGGQTRVEMNYDFGGIFDHGCLYAANSFWDPREERSIVFGWVPEDDLSENLRYAQGWSGALSMPRMLGIQTLYRVHKARTVALKEITSFKIMPDTHGTFEMQTLRIEPYPKLELLRKKSKAHQMQEVSIKSSGEQCLDDLPSIPLQTSQWELLCQLDMGPNCTRLGLRIEHLRGITGLP
jgi:beta-fructofuranosidase